MGSARGKARSKRSASREPLPVEHHARFYRTIVEHNRSVGLPSWTVPERVRNMGSEMYYLTMGKACVGFMGSEERAVLELTPELFMELSMANINDLPWRDVVLPYEVFVIDVKAGEARESSMIVMAPEWSTEIVMGVWTIGDGHNADILPFAWRLPLDTPARLGPEATVLQVIMAWWDECWMSTGDSDMSELSALRDLLPSDRLFEAFESDEGRSLKDVADEIADGNESVFYALTMYLNAMYGFVALALLMSAKANRVVEHPAPDDLSARIAHDAYHGKTAKIRARAMRALKHHSVLQPTRITLAPRHSSPGAAADDEGPYRSATWVRGHFRRVWCGTGEERHQEWRYIPSHPRRSTDGELPGGGGRRRYLVESSSVVGAAALANTLQRKQYSTQQEGAE